MNQQPEIRISALKVVIRGEEALKSAAWTVRFAMICRAVGALLLPWLPYCCGVGPAELPKGSAHRHKGCRCELEDSSESRARGRNAVADCLIARDAI